MNQQQTAFKSITIIFSAFLMGQVIFAAIAYFLVSTGRFESRLSELEKIFMVLVPVMIVGGRLAGKAFYDKRIQTAQNTKTAAEKLEIYRGATILRYAMLEGPVLFGIIGYLLTGSDMLILFVAAGILLFYMLKPTKAKAASELQVSEFDL